MISVSFFIGVSFLLEVLAGFDTRHDTPPSQTPSPNAMRSTTGRTLRRPQGLAPPAPCRGLRGRSRHEGSSRMLQPRSPPVRDPWCACRSATARQEASLRRSGYRSDREPDLVRRGRGEVPATEPVRRDRIVVSAVGRANAARRSSPARAGRKPHQAGDVGVVRSAGSAARSAAWMRGAP